MSITKINKSTKYLDHEKIFFKNFKKMLNGRIIIRKKINYLDIVFI